MDGERNLDLLLKTMQPLLMDGEWVFRTSESGFEAVAFRIVVVNYAAILFILGSFRPLSVTDFMWVHFLSSPDQRFGFACLAAA